MTDKLLTFDSAELLDFDTAFISVQKKIDNAFKKVPIAFRKMTEHLSLSAGKQIRAYSLLCSACDDMEKVHSDAVIAACAVELLHLATLIHDDIIDSSPLRRGEETLQKKFGKRAAVICGDYLLCLALEKAASVSAEHTDLAKIFLPYVTRICLGEMRQNINNENLNLSQFEYLKIISGKTAALFEMCFYSGFMLSKSENQMLQQNRQEKIKYKRLGYYIGMIFQLADDYMDYFVSEDTAKKPVQSDFEQGVMTLPLIFALKKNPSIKQLLKDGEISSYELKQLISLEGGFDHIKKFIEEYHLKAEKIIQSLNCSKEKKMKLNSVLNRAAGSVFA